MQRRRLSLPVASVRSDRPRADRAARRFSWQEHLVEEVRYAEFDTGSPAERRRVFGAYLAWVLERQGWPLLGPAVRRRGDRASLELECLRARTSPAWQGSGPRLLHARRHLLGDQVLPILPHSDAVAIDLWLEPSNPAEDSDPKLLILPSPANGCGTALARPHTTSY